MANPKWKKGSKPWNYGLKLGPMSDEQKKKHSLALKGKMPKNVVAGWNKGKKLSESHRKSLSEAKLKNPVRYWKGRFGERTGENAGNWRGGKTSERDRLRKSIEYKLWRTAVFERDNYACIFCGIRGGKLEADHIKPWCDYPELRFAIDNGRTLCHDCHTKTPTYLMITGRNQYTKKEGSL